MGMHTVAIWTFTFHEKRLCEGDFEGKFQNNLQASIMNFLMLKFKSITFIFLLFFPLLLSHSHCYFKKIELFESHFCNLNMSSHWNSSNSVQKAVDLTTPAKKRRKITIINLNFHIKKFMILVCTLIPLL